MVEHAGHANSLLLAPRQDIFPVAHGLPTWHRTRVAVQFRRAGQHLQKGPGPSPGPGMVGVVGRLGVAQRATDTSESRTRQGKAGHWGRLQTLF